MRQEQILTDRVRMPGPLGLCAMPASYFTTDVATQSIVRPFTPKSRELDTHPELQSAGRRTT